MTHEGSHDQGHGQAHECDRSYGGSGPTAQQADRGQGQQSGPRHCDSQRFAGLLPEHERSQAVGSTPLTVTAAGTTYTLTPVKVSPSAAPLAANKFKVIEASGIAEGLYQSAYSAKENALFVTTGYQTNGQWDGTLYKLNPTNLSVIASMQAPLVGTGRLATRSTAWVSMTSTAPCG